jgi:hypothetical protein
MLAVEITIPAAAVERPLLAALEPQRRAAQTTLVALVLPRLFPVDRLLTRVAAAVGHTLAPEAFDTAKRQQAAQVVVAMVGIAYLRHQARRAQQARLTPEVVAAVAFMTQARVTLAAPAAPASSS